MATVGKLKNMLKFDQQIKVIDEVRGMLDDITKKGVTMGESASLIEKRLGFKVTEGNVYGVLKALGVKLRKSPQAKADHTALLSLIEELAARITVIEETLKEVGVTRNGNSHV